MKLLTRPHYSPLHGHITKAPRTFSLFDLAVNPERIDGQTGKNIQTKCGVWAVVKGLRTCKTPRGRQSQRGEKQKKKKNKEITKVGTYNTIIRTVDYNDNDNDFDHVDDCDDKGSGGIGTWPGDGH